MTHYPARYLILLLLLILFALPICAEHFFVFKRSGEILKVDSPPTREGNLICFDLGGSRECLPVEDVDLKQTYVVPGKPPERKLREGTPDKVFTNEDMEKYSDKPPPQTEDQGEKEDGETASEIPMGLGDLEKSFQDFSRIDLPEIWGAFPGWMKAAIIFGSLLMMVIQAALAGLLMALLLRPAVRIVLKVHTTYGSVYKYSFISLLFTSIVNTLIHLLLLYTSPALFTMPWILFAESTLAWLLLSALAYTPMVPVRHSALTRYGQALLIALLQYLFMILVFGLLGAIVVGIVLLVF